MKNTDDQPDATPQDPTPVQSWPAPGPPFTIYEQLLLAVLPQDQQQTTTIEAAVSAAEAHLVSRRRGCSRLLRVVLLISIDRLVRQGRVLREGHDFVKFVDAPDPVFRLPQSPA